MGGDHRGGRPIQNSFYFTSEYQGTLPIYEIKLEVRSARPPAAQARRQSRQTMCAGRPECAQIVKGSNDEIAVSPDGKTLVFTQMSVQAPAEIYTALFNKSEDTCEKGSARMLRLPARCGAHAATQPHERARCWQGVVMQPLETFWFTGAAGAKVQGFLVKPPDFDKDKKYPVKFLIHGGPQGQWGDEWSYRWNPELFAASGYVIVMINPRGSTGYGQAFIDGINKDWGGKPYIDLMNRLGLRREDIPVRR